MWERSILILLLMGLTACGVSMPTYSPNSDGYFYDSDYYPDDTARFGSQGPTIDRLAHCNRITIQSGGTTFFDIQLKHPKFANGREDQDSLIIRLNYVDPTWLNANELNYIKFYRLYISNSQEYQDNYAFASMNSYSLRYAQFPFHAQVSGVSTSNVLRFEVTKSQNPPPSVYGLVPNFEADPVVYAQSHVPALGPLHPFASLAGQRLNFIDNARTLCF